MKKYLSLILALICVLLLASCGGEKTPEQTEKQAEWLDISQYTIYYADGVGADVSSALEELSGALSEAYGIQIKMESDFVLPGTEIPTDKKEILIGKTNRKESSALLSGDDSALDYHISFDGQKLCVAGATETATAEGVYFLISLIKGGGIFMDAGYKYDYIHKYECENAKIAGEDIKTYTIVYKDSKLAKEVAKDVCSVIFEKTGIELPTVREDKAEDGNYILIGSKEELEAEVIPDGHGYGIYVDGSTLCISYASGKAAYKSQDLVAELFSENFDISSAYTEVREAEVLKVSLLGDSNTALATIQEWLDVYLTTRYPDTLIELDNRGVSGDTASGAYERLSWDLYGYNPDVVIVCFGGNGMTENVGSLTDKMVSESIRTGRKNWYISNLTKLIEELQRNGKEVILASSMCYDEWMESKTAAYKYVYVTYIELTETMRELAGLLNIEFVDIYNNLLPITKEYREQTGDLSAALMSSDRKHVNLAGALAAAFAFVEDSRWANEVVASVEIAANSKEAQTENATVTVKQSKSDYIRYSYQPKAIPITVNEYYKQVKKYGTLDLDKYNQEIIKVTGLDAGEYEIRFDGKVIATVTAEELAAGVNIATLDKNPSQTASRYLYNELDAKRKNIASDRGFAYIEKNYIRKNDLGDLSNEEKFELYSDLIKTNAVSGYLLDTMKSFVNRIDEMKGYKAANDYADYTALKYAHPDAYSVEIVKK